MQQSKARYLELKSSQNTQRGITTRRQQRIPLEREHWPTSPCANNSSPGSILFWGSCGHKLSELSSGQLSQFHSERQGVQVMSDAGHVLSPLLPCNTCPLMPPLNFRSNQDGSQDQSQRLKTVVRRKHERVKRMSLSELFVRRTSMKGLFSPRSMKLDLTCI